MIFHSFLYVYQRVNHFFRRQSSTVSSASVTGAGAQGAQGCTEGGTEGGSEGQGVSEMFPCFHGKTHRKNHRKTGKPWENHGKMRIYPLVNIQKTDGTISILNGKTHYFDCAIFNSKLLNYQRVYHL